MIEQQESATAKLCAFARAWHAIHDREKIFDDDLAFDLMGRAEYDAAYETVSRGFGLSETPFSREDTEQIIAEYIAPIPLSTFAGQPTQSIGISFLKSYAAVCLEGAIIVLACIIFSLFAASPPAVDADAAPAAMVWKYVGELVFNMLVLVGAVKMSDHVVKEMMGL